jgi:hypothetical protein
LLIDENGGFTVVYWNKKGIIQDTSLTGVTNEEVQVDEGSLNFHAVQILPTNSNYLDRSTTLGQKLMDIMKYNVNEIPMHKHYQ